MIKHSLFTMGVEVKQTIAPLRMMVPLSVQNPPAPGGITRTFTSMVS